MMAQMKRLAFEFSQSSVALQVDAFKPSLDVWLELVQAEMQWNATLRPGYNSDACAAVAINVTNRSRYMFGT